MYNKDLRVIMIYLIFQFRFLNFTSKEQLNQSSNESKSESNLMIKEELKTEKNAPSNSTDQNTRKKEGPHWAKGMFLK